VTVLSIDDASLVEQARAGDERAFVALFKRYSRYVAGVAYRLLGDSAEVEDVVQEAFTDASQHMDQLRDGAGFKSWLVTICVRRVHKRLARRRRWRWFVSEAVHFEPTKTDPELRAKVVAIYQALEGAAGASKARRFRSSLSSAGCLSRRSSAASRGLKR